MLESSRAKTPFIVAGSVLAILAMGIPLVIQSNNEPLKSFRKDFATNRLPQPLEIHQSNDISDFRGHDFTIIEMINCHGNDCFPPVSSVQQRSCASPATCASEWTDFKNATGYTGEPAGGYGKYSALVNAISSDPATRCLYRNVNAKEGAAADTDLVCISPTHQLLLYRSMRI